MAGVLDSARFRYFLADEFNVSVEDVTAFVLGGHGDTMVPLVALFDGRRHSAARSRQDGLDLAGAARRDRPAHPRRRRRDRRPAEDRLGVLCAGGVGDRDGRSYLRDKKRVLPCAAFLNGEYGVKDTYVGVPVVIGAGGVERIVEIELGKDSEAFEKSVGAVQRPDRRLQEDRAGSARQAKRESPPSLQRPGGACRMNIHEYQAQGRC